MFMTKTLKNRFIKMNALHTQKKFGKSYSEFLLCSCQISTSAWKTACLECHKKLTKEEHKKKATHNLTLRFVTLKVEADIFTFYTRKYFYKCIKDVYKQQQQQNRTAFFPRETFWRIDGLILTSKRTILAEKLRKWFKIKYYYYFQ